MSTTDPGDQAPAGRPGRRWSWRWEQLLVVLAAGLIVVLAAGIVGHTLAGPAAPGNDSAEAGFARDMIDHHAQAVEMATIIEARTHDSAVRYLAVDIALGQTNQIGQLQGWLASWKLPVGRTGPPMSWMNHTDMNGMSGMSAGGHTGSMRLSADGLMPGMATTAQINQLRTKPPAAADVLFLQLMIRHHQAGVAMASTALDLTDNPTVQALARSIVASQQSEIRQMTGMLTQRGAHP